MAYTRTLAQLQTSFAIRGNYEFSTDITPAVQVELLNDALLETYDIVIACGDDFYVKIGSPYIVLQPNVDTYALPSDFYQLRKFEIAMDSTLLKWRVLRPVPVDGANRVSQWGLTGKRYRYRISNAGVTFAPLPQSPDTVRLYYCPLAPQLANPTDTITFDRPVEQKLVLMIALRDALDRQDLPTMEMQAKIDALAVKLRAAADSHDDGEPFYLSRRGANAYDDYDEDWY
jgi:hypothetical protein